MSDHPFVPLQRYDPGLPPEQAAKAFYDVMRQRRTVRMFSDRPVSLDAATEPDRALTGARGANGRRIVAADSPVAPPLSRRQGDVATCAGATAGSIAGNAPVRLLTGCRAQVVN